MDIFFAQAWQSKRKDDRAKRNLSLKKTTELSLFIGLLLINSFAFAENRESANAVLQGSSEQMIYVNPGNDYFTGPNHTDEHLTNNITIGYFRKTETKQDEVSSDIDIVKNFFLGKDTKSVVLGFTVSQFIYTPSDTERMVPDPTDQPYAGWLYTSGIIATRQGDSLVLYGVDIGIVGPSALGKKVQCGYHDLIGQECPNGWPYQLHDELGINLKASRVTSIYRKEGKLDRDLLAHADLSLGNVDTHARIGSTYRIGLNLPNDLNLGPLVDLSSDNISLFGYLKVQEKIVIRDIFLDGNSFKDSPSVDKKNYTTATSLGWLAKYRNLEIGYSYDYETKRFKTQVKGDKRASIQVAYRLPFN